MLLPNAERQAEIHFHVAKWLPYAWRLFLAFSLIAVGLLVEAAFLDSIFWCGLLMIAAGVSLLIARGYGNVALEQRKYSEWRAVRREDVLRILETNARQRKWDSDAIDITCIRGALTLVGAAALVFAGAVFLSRGQVTLLQLLMLNAALMLLPFWLTGVRFILKNNQLIVKTRMLTELEQAYGQSERREGEVFEYQMQTAAARKTKGGIPHDVKAMLRFSGAPETFLGLQMQVCINSVQGKDYPYFYCVLVARPEFGGLERGGQVLQPRGLPLVVDARREDDVDILIIRRNTTIDSGYHTPKAEAVRILFYAVARARKLLEDVAGKA